MTSLSSRRLHHNPKLPLTRAQMYLQAAPSQLPEDLGRGKLMLTHPYHHPTTTTFTLQTPSRRGVKLWVAARRWLQ